MAYIFDIGVPDPVLFTERPPMTPIQPTFSTTSYAFGTPNTPDIVGFDNVRGIYISRNGHAWRVDNSTGLWYDMGIASDYYGTLPGTSTGPGAGSTGSGGYLAIVALIAALYFMG